MQKKKRMIDIIGEPAMLEQLAEEATELAKAALKLARIERKENPTPVTKEEATLNLIEEYTDVMQCTEELGLLPNREQMEEKYKRFLARQGENLTEDKDDEEAIEKDTSKDNEGIDVEDSDELLAELLQYIENTVRTRDFVDRNRGRFVIKPMGRATIKRTGEFPYPSGEWIFYE